MKRLTGLRLGFSHLCKDKLRHNFEDNYSTMFLQYQTRNDDAFFLRCQFYNVIRANPPGELLNIDSSLFSECDQKLLDFSRFYSTKQKI